MLLEKFNNSITVCKIEALPDISGDYLAISGRKYIKTYQAAYVAEWSNYVTRSRQLRELRVLESSVYKAWFITKKIEDLFLKGIWFVQVDECSGIIGIIYKIFESVWDMMRVIS